MGGLRSPVGCAAPKVTQTTLASATALRMRSFVQNCPLIDRWRPTLKLRDVDAYQGRRARRVTTGGDPIPGGPGQERNSRKGEGCRTQEQFSSLTIIPWCARFFGALSNRRDFAFAGDIEVSWSMTVRPCVGVPARSESTYSI